MQYKGYTNAQITSCISYNHSLINDFYRQGFEFFRAFLTPVFHGENSGKFQNQVKVAFKAIVLIFLSLYDG